MTPQAVAGGFPSVETAIAAPAAVEPDRAHGDDEQFEYKGSQLSRKAKEIPCEKEVGINGYEGGEQPGAVDSQILRELGGATLQLMLLQKLNLRK